MIIHKMHQTTIIAALLVLLFPARSHAENVVTVANKCAEPMTVRSYGGGIDGGSLDCHYAESARIMPDHTYVLKLRESEMHYLSTNTDNDTVVIIELRDDLRPGASTLSYTIFRHSNCTDPSPWAAARIIPEKTYTLCGPTFSGGRRALKNK
jgi:hypothetical protein